MLTIRKPYARLGLGRVWELTNKEALKMRTKIKKTIKTLPKDFSLLLLAVGFVYAFRTVAKNDPVLTGSGILLAMFLISTARK